jgi:hypothetical protein
MYNLILATISGGLAITWSIRMAAFNDCCMGSGCPAADSST